MQHADFLVEIHTEELPPKTLVRLASSFLKDIEAQLTKSELRYRSACYFVTPRRLAVLVKRLASTQPDTTVERKGPALAAAFDASGQPTQACMGFARSCGVTPDQLRTIKTPQGEWVGYEQHVTGKSVQDILPGIVQQALNQLPIAKRMRWGNRDVQFVRPVHSVILLYGNDVIPAVILGHRAGQQTEGHRFHSKGWFTIASPVRYESRLEKNHVIADFTRRKEMIREQVNALVKKQLGDSAKAIMSDPLLDEVTGLVEWPNAICGSFDKSFLEIPQEALISAMQDHQRYFPVVDEQQHLLPYFIAVSNIVNEDMSRIIGGNQRVLRARLADAAFFFETDKKTPLSDRVDTLKHIVFQEKLGTLYDKTTRVTALALQLAKQWQVSLEDTKRAALLAKTDLTTEMVKEFPELQGIMGFYYAKADGESVAVANALNEQYCPRFSGDVLPASTLGCVLAIADRIDTLVGVFGMNQVPTGDKDPFGLRRAALGILRILIEKKLHIDLRELIAFALQQYTVALPNQDTAQQAFTFILDRLRPWYQEQGILPDVLASVAALNLVDPYDIHLRVCAVQAFKQLADAESLSVANKRVSNILAKYDGDISSHQVNESLFEQDIERQLESMLASKRTMVTSLSKAGDYTEVLQQLAGLRQPVDQYFDQVLVMADDKARRENRLLMLKELRELFLQVADIALLQ